MAHHLVSEALLGLGVPHFLVAAIMTELKDLWAQIAVSGLGATEWFCFHRGGRQGGVETPRIFAS
eukprot:6178927-Karenia_brevis.AAC.1